MLSRCSIINRYHRPSGFNYENYFRNEEMKRMGYEPPMPMTTGTTVVGLEFDGGIMIASDTCAQRQNLITSTAIQKIFRLNNSIYCGGCGYFSDVRILTRLLRRNIEFIFKQCGGRPVPLVCVKQVAKYLLMSQSGRLIASLVLGGVDANGVHLYSVHFDGTTEKCMFTSIGTGQYCAIGILEEGWKFGISESDARELIVDAINAGIKYDARSACSVDLVIIRSDYTVETHTVENYTAETLAEQPYTPPRRIPLPICVKGETDNEEDISDCIYILEEKVTPLKIIIPTPIPEKTEKTFNKGLRKSRAVTQFNFNPIIDHHSDDDDDDGDDDDDLPPRKRIKIEK